MARLAYASKGPRVLCSSVTGPQLTQSTSGLKTELKNNLIGNDSQKWNFWSSLPELQAAQ